MAPNGQTTLQRAHPVQSVGWCNTADFGPQLYGPCTANHNTRGGHAATQRPQPVHRSGLIWGRALRTMSLG